MDKIFRHEQWNLPTAWRKIETIDMHTGGEPLRIIIGGLPEIEGSTILEKQRFFKEKLDYIRTGLMFEPRGHADMYGAIVTEPVTDDADFGTFFLHNEGYSSMCGHAIIALTRFAIETGMVKTQGNNPELVINVPSGKVYSKAFIVNGIVEEVSFRNVPSFVYLENADVEVSGIGKVAFDIAYGGAFYVFCNADDLSLELNQKNHNMLIEYGRKIKHAVMEKYKIIHPYEPDLSFLYGTIFIGKPENPDNHSRNVCIFAEGELDRSPTGTGVSARSAIHFSRNEIDKDQSITIESIVGSTMKVKVVEETIYGQFDAVIPEVSGKAYFTAKNSFVFDPSDSLKDGFILR